MTIESTTTRKSYDGNDVSTMFVVPFKFLANEDLVVILHDTTTGEDDEQILDTDYTVTGAGSEDGGAVTFTTAPATGKKVVIYRDPPITQTTDWLENDPDPAEVKERAFDKLTMIAQRLDERVDRSLRQPDGDEEGLSMVLPPVEERASKYLGFDANGEPIATAGTAVDADVSDKTVKATGASAARTLAEHLATLPDSKITPTGGTQSRPLAARAGDLLHLSDFASLSEAVSEIGATEATLYIDAATAPAMNVTVPSNVSLLFDRGGQINPASGVTVTINGPIQAGVWRIFAGDGTIAGTPIVREIFPEWFGATGDGSTNDTDAFQAAIDLIDTAGNAQITLQPNGVYVIGTGGLEITGDNITVDGRGAEIRQVTAGQPGIITSGNRVTIRGIYFNSSAAKTGSTSSGAYRAGIHYHSAVLQISGDDLTVEDCRFYNWTTCVGFHGSQVDANTIAKNLVVRDCFMDKYDFGVLARQFDGCRLEGLIGEDCENTTTNDGGVTFHPGHLVYITDRTAAQSKSLVIEGCIERDNTSSSSIKVRNVSGVTINGCVSEGCVRGMEVGFSEHVTFNGCVVTGLVTRADDSQQTCFEVTDSENVTLTGCRAEIPEGVIAYGYRLRSDLGTFGNRLNHIVDCTVHVAWDAASTHPAVIVTDQNDVTIKGLRFHNSGLATPIYPVRVGTGCNRLQIVDPIFFSNASTANKERLVQIDAGAQRTYVRVDDMLWNSWDAVNSISDSGTDTTTRVLT